MSKISYKLRSRGSGSKKEYVVQICVSIGAGIENYVRRNTTVVIKSDKSWNKKDERVRKVSSESYDFLNEKLVKYYSFVDDEIRKLEKDKVELTTQNVAEIIDSYKDSKAIKRKSKVFNFNDAFLEYIEGMRTGAILMKKPKEPYSQRSIKNYESTFKKIKEFQEKYGVIKPSNINEELYLNLIKYMRFECDVVHKNTYINKVVSQLGIFLKRKVKKSMKISLPNYDQEDFSRLNEEETYSIALNNDELKKMFLLDLSKKPEGYNSEPYFSKDWSIYRDAFLFSAFTCGIRVEDYRNCTYEQNVYKENGVLFFIYVQSKTGNKVNVPIPAPALRILERNNNQLPLIKNKARALKVLKQVGRLCGIDEVHKYPEKRGVGKPKMIIKKRYELILNHTARKSFCTNAYKSGVDALTVKHYSGHKKMDEFLKYVKHTHTDHLRIYEGSKFFKNFSEDKDYNKLTIVA